MKITLLASALLVGAGLVVFSAISISSEAQQTRHIHVRTADAEKFLLTVVLRHDQTKSQDEITAHLEKTKFHDNFPPEDITIVSWKAVMGLGQVIVLEVPARKIRDVNEALERDVRGAFQTEFYATYNLVPEIEAKRGKPLPRPDWWVEPRITP